MGVKAIRNNKEWKGLIAKMRKMFKKAKAKHGLNLKLDLRPNFVLKFGEQTVKEREEGEKKKKMKRKRRRKEEKEKRIEKGMDSMIFVWNLV